jgi:hypothetical protein
MTWHLLCDDPTRFKIPKSHRIRAISHEEFSQLAENLELYHLEQAITVRRALDSVVLKRLTGLKVRQCSISGMGYEHNRLPKRLALGDFVLAFQPLVSGCYVIYSYARADNDRFREMVATWGIEPSNSSYLEPQRIILLAQQFVEINRKINRVIEIMAEPECHADKPDVYQLRALFEGFRQQKDRILHEPVLSDVKRSRKL